MTGAAVAVSAILGGPASAQIWTGNTSTDWTTASNWQGAAVPSGGVGVQINVANPVVLGVGPNAVGKANGLLLGGTSSSLTVQNGATLNSKGNVGISGTGAAGSSATVTGPGSEWTADGALFTMGGSGKGTLTIEGGALVDILGELRLGSSSEGTLNIRGGGMLNTTAPAVIGRLAGSVGTANVSGPGSSWIATGQIIISDGGTGTLNIEDGATVKALGGVHLSGGATVGTLNVRGGGTLETTGLTRGLATPQASFDNATLRALASFTSGLGVNESTIGAGGLTVDANGFVIDAAGFNGAGGLTVTGAGGLTLTGASTYAGETRIATGSKLTLSGSASIAASSGVTLGDGGIFDISAITPASMTMARLAGTGTVVQGAKALMATVISPGGDGSIGTLTISGDYAGTGNTLLIDTVLGDDSSETDRLVITGTSMGGSNVVVTNRGGVGGVTATGIKIIDVGGNSDAIFSLLGDTTYEGQEAVIGGAYLYGLVQDTGNGDWYLRTIIDDEPVFQPGAPVIEAYVGAALQAFNTTESLVQRIGNRTLSDGNGLWGRIEAGHVSIAPDSTTGAGYDVTTWQLQAGLDGVLNQSEAGTLVGGINAQFGIISADISSASGVGSVVSNGYGLGATLTWYGSEGFYLDAQGKLTWFDSTLDSETLGTTIVSDNAGFGYALSLEAGRQLTLGDGWSVTPQAQLAYSSVDFDAFDSYGSTVALQSGDSLLGRLGLSADYESEWQDTAGETGKTHVYGIANLSYEFLDGTATSVGGDTLSSKADPLWGGIGLGGSVDWAGDKLSLYGEANVGTSLNSLGDSYSFGVTAGIKGRL